MPVLTCKQVAEFLMAYLDGDLAITQRLRLDRHLDLCRDCRNYLTGYSETIRASQAAFDEADLMTAIPQELLHAILVSRQADDPCG